MARLVVVLDVEGLAPTLVDPHVVVEAITGAAVGDPFFDSLPSNTRHDLASVLTSEGLDPELVVLSAEWEA